MLEAFGDGALFGERYGASPPWLLALPGWARGHEDFRSVICPGGSDDHGATTLDAIGLDLPGFGASPPPREPAGSRWYAQAIAPVLDEYEAGAVVLGHSFGGRVALQLANLYPERVRALCLVGVPQLVERAGVRHLAFGYRVVRFARHVGLVREERLERARQRYGSRDYREASPVMRGVLVAVLAECYGEILERLTIPVRFVWGSEDSTAPLADAEQAIRLVGTGQLDALAGVGHMLPLDAPQALRHALLELRGMRVDYLVTLCVGVLAVAASDLRWLRVAQREHYLPGAPLRFAWRWWFGTAWAALAACVGGALALAGLFYPVLSIGAVVIFGVGPVGLTISGWSAPLAWTRRASLVATLSVLFEALWIGFGARVGGLFGAAGAVAVVAAFSPMLVDLALQVLSPVESLLAKRHVRRAEAVLRRVAPTVVGITGSYGKTSTKGYLAHLLGQRFSVVASPRSFNNRAGLSRTVNEHLEPGTDVLVAEMGAYGPGEIAALCRWLHPTVSVITAIGPVHLERFGTLDKTLAAKAEITAEATTVVLNVDDERLSALADELEAAGRVVLRCSGVNPAVDVAVLEEGEALVLYRRGRCVGAVAPIDEQRPVASTNVACAVGAALALGCDDEELVRRLGDLPQAENRLEVRASSSGAIVLDDTFNANPAGARLALRALQTTKARHRVVVTPGMVELGALQSGENMAFATAAAAFVSDFVIVGRTNRRALRAGAEAAERGSELRVREARRREDAVEWARTEFGSEDVILYENDLPDHYP